MRDWFYAAEHDNSDLNKEFISGVRDLVTQLSRERPLYGPPWVAVVDHTSRELFFNRVTGEARLVVCVIVKHKEMSCCDVLPSTVSCLFLALP